MAPRVKQTGRRPADQPGASGKLWLPENASDDVLATDVWGDDAILSYVPETGDNFQVPSYGYTYELRGKPTSQKPCCERDSRVGLLHAGLDARRWVQVCVHHRPDCWNFCGCRSGRGNDHRSRCQDRRQLRRLASDPDRRAIRTLDGIRRYQFLGL